VPWQSLDAVAPIVTAPLTTTVLEPFAAMPSGSEVAVPPTEYVGLDPAVSAGVVHPFAPAAFNAIAVTLTGNEFGLVIVTTTSPVPSGRSAAPVVVGVDVVSACAAVRPLAVVPEPVPVAVADQYA
jgi:hypothetical protein